ncbi:MAG: adenosine deaminase [Pseudomonadota bacterium]
MAPSNAAPADPTFFDSLPKAELHLHIEGSLTPQRMLSLAESNDVSLPYADEAAILEAYNFDSLQSFLDLYYQGMSALLKEEDFYALTMDYLEVCRRENIVHTEIGFDPQGHTGRGVDLGVVIAGITGAMQDAKRNWGQSSLLLMNFLRHLPPDSAMQTLEAARQYADVISAVGLDSSEVGFPPEPFKEVFDQAVDIGWRRVAHAGEEGPPAYIWGAINSLHVDRIDHGIRAEEDEALIKHLIESQLPLTVCPLSNVRLCAVDHMSNHNLMRLLQAGVRVTVNSDDPSYFGGFLSQNYAAVAEHIGMTIDEASQLARNSITASFLPEDEQQPILQSIDDWRAQQSGG